MKTIHSLDDLKRFHNDAMIFFGAELMLLKEITTKIDDERLGKCSILLISSGQTGAALLQLASQIDCFASESVMLARAFMEKITNFCYAAICDEKEFRAFVLHPIYKKYHNLGATKMEDDLNLIDKNIIIRKEKQEKFKKNAIVQEALNIFSEKKSRLNWTKKTLNQRIDVIQEWGKLMDVFFTINKLEYYSDASEVLHGSMYGCTYSLGIFDDGFDRDIDGELEKKMYKDNTCMLLHLGMLMHETLTLISYSNNIDKEWSHSYKNRGVALNLLFYVLGRKIK
ncbi:DUF5677 domain-containing protein [Flavobacterium collinsii]|nr:DUF5677 domain-containing protein [Flavobacterium collinsii]